jgi:hypothetical protein
VFRYETFTIDPDRGLLTCGYSVEEHSFTERISLTPGAAWRTPQARAAARLVFLLAGVSYYKTTASPVIDLGEHALTDAERDFLRSFYLDGLAEFAYRNNLDLSALRIDSPRAPNGPNAHLGRQEPAQMRVWATEGSQRFAKNCRWQSPVYFHAFPVSPSSSFHSSPIVALSN